jgi:hypothetical protein
VCGRVSFRLKQVPIDTVILKLLTVVNCFLKELLTVVPVCKYIIGYNIILYHRNTVNFAYLKRPAEFSLNNKYHRRIKFNEINIT